MKLKVFYCNFEFRSQIQEETAVVESPIKSIGILLSGHAVTADVSILVGTSHIDKMCTYLRNSGKAFVHAEQHQLFTTASNTVMISCSGIHTIHIILPNLKFAVYIIVLAIPVEISTTT